MKPLRKKNHQTISSSLYDSIQQAMVELGIKGKPIGAILKSIIGKTDWVYGYNWKLVKLKL